ncbi:Branched-chain amino acid ABC transporter, permease protein [Alteracholeplasma palmae J233]|uniref:Branched-chain amino acid ABC transporter, permease protein n=1 Tax=Alteracholeplasma palmae (strain ATCC 49389 / J233) TaxID=1318466 RepID=U4KRT9_ALTPJ|nr:ABC transporter permease [Alteracholeplasma palmae]CCV64431.1 Branched-chain amino acid ABC transporter, permease protein [Alteracholeplasma palmae J233]
MELIRLSFISIIPLLIVALGGLMSEKSGVTNIALEGIMLLGAFCGIWIIKGLEASNMPIQFIYFIGILAGGFIGALVASLHAYASISMKADQTISATAINLFAPAFAIFTARIVIGAQQIKFKSNFRIDKVPLLGDIPFIGDLFFKNTYLSFYIGIVILIIVWVFLYKTKTGLRIRAVGENPHAADSQGVSVKKIRYLSVILSGVLAGMGGVIFVATTSNSFDATVAGMGFLAIAVLIFGNWRPGRILFAAVFFGFFRTVASAPTLIPFLQGVSIPSEIYQMLPYVITLVVLAFTSKNSRAPKSIGQVYEKDKR